jgi:hypothetical protein
MKFAEKQTTPAASGQDMRQAPSGFERGYTFAAIPALQRNCSDPAYHELVLCRITISSTA